MDMYWIILVFTSCIYAVGGQHLFVAPVGKQIKTLNERIMFTCSIKKYEVSGFYPTMTWKGPTGTQITATSGRVHIERDDILSLRLYIGTIHEGDAGNYTCQADLETTVMMETTSLSLFEDIQFTNLAQHLEVQPGGEIVIPCRATGEPVPEMSYRFQRNRLPSDGEKYRYESEGLRIYNVAPEDSGEYECRAEVKSQGNLKVRYIQLDVLYPPMILRGFNDTVAVEGSKVELHCKAKGNPSVSFTWSRTIPRKEQRVSEMFKIKVPLKTVSDIHVIESMSKDDIGRYFCKVSNNIGEEVVAADVNMMVPPRVTPLRDREELEGRTVIIPCVADGDPLPELTWSRKTESEDTEEELTVDTSQPGTNKLIIREIKRSHDGEYTCTATSPAGTDSKSFNMVVEYGPSAEVADVKKLGWPGQVRKFECTGWGLPLPDISWLRGGQYISDDGVYTISTNANESHVYSTLEIDIAKRATWVYGSYQCIAKNNHGFVTKRVSLEQATEPDMPRNVTVTEVTTDTVRITAGDPSYDGGKPLLGWSISYEPEGQKEERDTLLFQRGDILKVHQLKPGTTYKMYLAATNVVGVGKPVKFRFETHLKEKAASDVPAETPKKETHHNQTDAEASKGNKMIDEPIKIDKSTEPEVAGPPMLMIIAVVASVVLIGVFVLIIIVCMKRKRRNENKYATTEVTSAVQVSGGRDVDNMQLAILRPDHPTNHYQERRSPPSCRKGTPSQSRKNYTPVVVRKNSFMASACASPMSSRSNIATTPTKQEYDWVMMMRRQALEPNEEGEEQPLPDTPPPNHGPMDLPPPPKPHDPHADLPPPPPYLLQSTYAQDNPYNDILDGYHSEDNMDYGDSREHFKHTHVYSTLS